LLTTTAAHHSIITFVNTHSSINSNTGIAPPTILLGPLVGLQQRVMVQRGMKSRSNLLNQLQLGEMQLTRRM
jgi:hypothetical protein